MHDHADVDYLHDMDDPIGRAAHDREHLERDATGLLVEPTVVIWSR